MKKNFFLILAVGYLLTGVMGNRLPQARRILPSLYHEPRQTETSSGSFTVRKGGIQYTVTPRYKYELYGLIVSEQETQGWLDYYHGRWKDRLNIKDVCVIWGDNVKSDNFRKLKYKSGSWTCYFSTKDRQVYARFDPDQLSNNHMLVDDPDAARALLKARRGDQVYFRGYLADYAHGEGFNRQTSVTRHDRAGGACEVVFAKKFEILKKGNPFWRAANTFFLWGTVLALTVGIYRFFKISVN